MPIKRDLTDKQKCFVEEYLVDLNATQAAIRAGYSTKTADHIGPELLTKPCIRDKVARAMAARSCRTGINQDRVLREIARVAFINPDAVIDFESGSLRDGASADDLACVAGVKVKTSTFGEDGKSVEREIKLNDKIKALDMLCKHLGIYADAKGNAPGTDSSKGETGVLQMPAIMDAPEPPPDDDGGVTPDA